MPMKEAQDKIIALKDLATTLKENLHIFLAGSTMVGASIYFLARNRNVAIKAVDPYGRKASKTESSKTRHNASLVNLIFLKKLYALAKIAIPGIGSREMRLIVVYSLFLLARTYLSIRISEVNGLIVKSIVSIDRAGFLRSLLRLASFTVPASIVNSMLKFLLAKLSFSFRARLIDYFNSLYFKPKIAYKVVNIDNRVTDPADIMTTTVTEWGEELANLYSNISKPILDIFLFSKRLAELLGFQGPAAAFVYYFLTAICFRYVSPMFGKLTAKKFLLEGHFKHLHSRLINYAEEIALYRGNKKEKQNLDEAFKSIEFQSCYVTHKEFVNALFRGFISKYGSFLTAYTVLGFPVFRDAAKVSPSGLKNSDIVGEYIRNSNLYINLSVAIGKIIVSYNSIQKLAGYTKVIHNFKEVLNDLDNDLFVRFKGSEENIVKREFKSGNVDKENDFLSFRDLSIVTPNGDRLCEGVSFVIRHSMHLLITGPNGCGKSSLFRILSGLWSIEKGEVSKSAESDLFYIPQRPYLLKGTLREQIIYPQSEEEFEKISNDEKIKNILHIARISYICDERKNGLDEVKDWQEMLSGGEKQQIALARVIYHKPVYAILDECTSAISFDLEQQIYSYCKKAGITLITVSHRKSLWKYHHYLLEFDGRGGWEFRLLTDEDLE